MNQSLFSTKVSFLPRVDCDDSEITTKPLGELLVTNKWRGKIEELRAEKDPAKQQELKRALPCFTPSGTFTHVSRAGLVQHSGFISLDIDYKPEKGINKALAGADLKADISAVPHVAYCGKSCRGAGYVIIIPIADPTKHNEYFRALAYYFDRVAGLEVDRACKDVSRKRFVSWDDSPYINTSAKPWSITLPARDSCTTRETMGRDMTDQEITAKVEKIINYCEANKLDITEKYDDWMRILTAIASQFGENGREYAHRISAIYSAYCHDETERKYNDLLKHPEYKTQIGTLFYIARLEMGRHDFDNIDLCEQ